MCAEMATEAEAPYQLDEAYEFDAPQWFDFKGGVSLSGGASRASQWFNERGAFYEPVLCASRACCPAAASCMPPWCLPHACRPATASCEHAAMLLPLACYPAVCHMHAAQSICHTLLTSCLHTLPMQSLQLLQHQHWQM